MKKSIHISYSPSQTKALGQKLAEAILKLPSKHHARVLSLEGELGSGKTTFSQGFAKGLGVRERVSSPTFVIMRPHKLRTKNYKLFYHIDCYRLKNGQELLDLGWKGMVTNPRAIMLIEWGNRVKSMLPKHAIRISFSHT
ncbi:MAG: tRNA (adenosine(37)-N6)-threonylcarbamoyltransferase complex ATPase subunit type 1 TsaE [bacterium]|nr:tRNA (adenosine(37)-N6)-threonylcarbamoyltransferase complex ATPase subunit type 1 TsaE [bacterium]